MHRYESWLLAALRAAVAPLAGLALLCASSPLFAYEFSPGEFEAARDLAIEVVNRFPPDQFVYVGVGRSPTPLTAALRAAGMTDVVNLPLTAFAHRLTPPMGNSANERPLPPHREPELFGHFAAHLPSSKALAGRKVLLIDFAESGKGLLAAYDYVSEFLGRDPGKNKVVALALFGGEPQLKPPLVQNAQVSGIPLRLIELPKAVEPNLFWKIEKSRFEPYAEFTAYTPGKIARAQIKRNAAYDDLVKSFRDRGAADPKFQRLAQRLASSGPRLAASVGKAGCSDRLRTELRINLIGAPPSR